MPFISSFTKAAVAAVLAGQALAVPLGIHPIPNDFTVTVNNTVNGTTIHNAAQPVASNAPASPLPLTFVNNVGGNVNAYLTGTDGDGAAFFLQKDGTAYYPANPAAGIPPTQITADIGIALDTGSGSSVTVNLPNFVSSGRIYFSVGTMEFAVNNGEKGPVVVAPSFTNPTDPSIDTNYGFVEFTWDATLGIYSNLSYVDFIGLIISQMVQTSDQGTCTVKGLPGGAVNSVCSALAAQSAKDGQAWSQSCETDSSGNNVRVLAPLHLTELVPSALQGYFDPYVDKVWEKYTNEDLVITAGDVGNFTGRVDSSSGLMVFDEGGSYAKPVLGDILGCNSGPFANPGGESAAAQSIVPRLCAAFDRSTLLLDGGNVQPDGVDQSQYYPTDGTPTNHYSRIVHELELDGKGYAFAYDDVHASNMPDVSGLCTGKPTGITWQVGGAS